MPKPSIDTSDVSFLPDVEHNQSTAFDLTQSLIPHQIMKMHPKLTLRNQQTSELDLTYMIYENFKNTADRRLEDVLSTICQNTFADYPTNIGKSDIDLIYAYAAATRVGWLPPKIQKGSVIYTPMDVIEGASDVLTQGTTDKLHAALTYNYNPKVLGLIVENPAKFEELKESLALYASVHTKSHSVQKQFDQLDKITFKKDTLTQSLLLRRTNDDILEPNSFGTILLSFLTTYTKNNGTTRLAPFSYRELTSPRAVVFINAEAHTDAEPDEINIEWLKINKSVEHPLNIVSTKNITKLETAFTAYQKATAPAAAGSNANPRMQKQAKMQFRKTRPTTVDISRLVEKRLHKMGAVNRSNNVVIKPRMSPLRQSRRQPNNPNAFGRIHNIRYYPDLHIYLDCSGSISVDEQKDGIIALVKIAKKLNVDIYFSSFSEILSQETYVPTKGKSAKQIWNYILAIPKVSGWTDFRQISDYIMMSPERQARFNLVLTDYGWVHRGSNFAHPKNLYYAPLSTNSWDEIIEYAKGFIESMETIEPRRVTLSRCLGIFK